MIGNLVDRMSSLLAATSADSTGRASGCFVTHLHGPHDDSIIFLKVVRTENPLLEFAAEASACATYQSRPKFNPIIRLKILQLFGVIKWQFLIPFNKIYQ